MKLNAPRLCTLGEAGVPALVWDVAPACRALSSSVLGGGLGLRHWVLNAQVDAGYARTDPALHLAELAHDAGCRGPGVGFLTAASVDRWTSGRDGGVEACATVGLRHPEWAATDATEATQLAAPTVGTINLVVFVPVPLSDAAMVNAVATATEAKVQALFEAGVDGTGTASDAVCVLAPLDGEEEPFCGPRSRIGSALARAVRDAVGRGVP
ncbi:MAG TPA: adenosylcobinamide amidohydrolase [Acidimicrobiia bacterium]